MAVNGCKNNDHQVDNGEDSSKIEHWLIQNESGRKQSVKFRAKALSVTPALQVGKALNLTYRLTQSDTWLVNSLLSSHGLCEVSHNSNDFNLLWTGSHPRPHTFSSMKYYQRVNHFPRSYELTRKDRLFKNVAKFQHTYGAKHFDFLPPSFVMPNEYREFWSAHHRLHGPWIVKPVASSRGRGIYLVSKPEEVPLEEPVLVSKYISNPLLVDGHKCDLRLYVVVTCYDPLVIYLYRHGIVRFAAVKYTSDQNSLDNPCIHLCNYSINKYHADFVVSEDPSAEGVGHKRSLTSFLKCLRAQGKDVARLMQRVEDVVIKSIMATTPPVAAAVKMFVPHRSNCFELYGFDILIDADLKPWLLEVNLSPSLGCDSTFDMNVKSAMLADLLTLVGLPAVDPSSTAQTSSTGQRQGRAKATPSQKERNQYRRAQSADPQQRNKVTTKPANKLTSSTSSLTAEESRILSQLRDDFERRGEFNRIFPSETSWSLYGDFIETLYSSSPGLSSTGSNFNRMVHDQLYPPSQNQANQYSAAKLPPKAPRKRTPKRATKSAPVRGAPLALVHHNWSSLNEESDVDEIKPPATFYEEATLQHIAVKNHGTSHSKKNNQINGLPPPIQVKKEIHEMFENEHILSQEQSRRGFSRYLRYILKRLPFLENSVDGDLQLDLIERFLLRLNGNNGRLRSASPAKQSPIRKLASRDRVAVVASQLSEFLDRYDRDNSVISSTQHNTDCEGELRKHKLVTSQIFDDFLSFASEKDIEEVLCQHSKIAPCSHFLSGRCHPRMNNSSSSVSARNSTNLGLLREACCLSAGRVIRSNSKKEEAVEPLGRNAVVTFDLSCVSSRRVGSPLRPIKSSILKREKSM